MKNILIRIVALLLAPCLLLDPSFAAAEYIYSLNPLTANNSPAQFSMNALAPLVVEKPTAMGIPAGHVRTSFGRLIYSSSSSRERLHDFMGAIMEQIGGALETYLGQGSSNPAAFRRALDQIESEYNPMLTEPKEKEKLSDLIKSYQATAAAQDPRSHFETNRRNAIKAHAIWTNA
jgi:hypothetical protein